MRTCPRCGNKANESDHFCTTCGYEFTDIDGTISSNTVDLSADNEAFNRDGNPNPYVNNNHDDYRRNRNPRRRRSGGGFAAEGLYYSSGIKIAVLILMIIAIAVDLIIAILRVVWSIDSSSVKGLTVSFIYSVWTFLPIFWMIPMTIITYRKFKNDEDFSNVWCVLILLFVNLIAGILLLVCKKK